LKGKTWYWITAAMIPVRTAYGMEKHFHPDSIKKNVDGGTKRSGKFDKIKNGINVPSTKTVEQAGIEHPETLELFYHPFWVVARQPIVDTNEFYMQLSKLRPKISNTLFERYRKQGTLPVRRSNGIFSEIDELSKESDLDAFTACVGLLQEVTNYKMLPEWIVAHYAHQTFSVFLRFISQPPYFFLAKEYFEYFRNFYFEKYLSKDQVKTLDSIDLAIVIEYYQTITTIIEDYQILRHHLIVPTICLTLAEKYLTPKIVIKMVDLRLAGKFYESKKLPEFRNLVKCLRR